MAQSEAHLSQTFQSTEAIQDFDSDLSAAAALGVGAAKLVFLKSQGCIYSDSTQ